MKAAALLLALLVLAISAEPLPKSPDPRIQIELVAEAPNIVTPTGLGVDSKGRVLVIESHTHFRPKDYQGPERDRVLMFIPQKNGKAKRSIFYEGLNMGMDTCVGADDWVYLAERSRILRAKDTTGDGKADLVEDVVSMETTGTYPHNGLSGLCFDLKGNLVFGLGENLGHAYTMTGRDGRKIEGAQGIGGGVFRCSAEGNQLKQIARGFWNPFGVCVDSWGRIFAVDNDPGHSPPCRLLHVVQDGDYGYRYKHGRTGIHPFIAWNGELLGTLPMVHGTGEGPCEVIHFNSPTFPKEYRGRLLVTSWGDHRVESYILKPNGASVTASMEPLVQGGDSFRPVGLAMAPDGSLYVSDWGSSSYNLNHKGRLWRIRPTRDFKAPALKEPDYLKPSQKQFSALTAGHLPEGKTFAEIAINNSDPFIRHAALSNFPEKPISRALHAHVSRYSESRNIKPGSLTLMELIKKEPDILFEFLRWTAEDGVQTNRPSIVNILKSGQIDYRNFRAALACLDSLDGRNNPDRFNEKYALPLLQNETTPAPLRANILRYFPDNHSAIDDQKLAEWITSQNPQLQREAIWKSRTHLTEATQQSLSKLALNARAPLPLRLEAIAAIGNTESPDAGTLIKILQLKNTTLQAEALRSFWLELGITQKDISVPLATLYSHNTKAIDATAPRLSFVRHPIAYDLEGEHPPSLELDVHPNDASMGKRKWSLKGRIWLEGEDLEKMDIRLKEFADVALHDQKAEIESFDRQDNRPVVHWLPVQHANEATLIETKNDQKVHTLGQLEKHRYPTGTVVQLERVGYALVLSEDTLILCHEERQEP